MRTKCLLLLGSNEDKVGAGYGSMENTCLRQHRALDSVPSIAQCEAVVYEVVTSSWVAGLSMGIEGAASNSSRQRAGFCP